MALAEVPLRLLNNRELVILMVEVAESKVDCRLKESKLRLCNFSICRKENTMVEALLIFLPWFKDLTRRQASNNCQPEDLMINPVKLES